VDWGGHQLYSDYKHHMCGQVFSTSVTKLKIDGASNGYTHSEDFMHHLSNFFTMINHSLKYLSLTDFFVFPLPVIQGCSHLETLDLHAVCIPRDDNFPLSGNFMGPQKLTRLDLSQSPNALKMIARGIDLSHIKMLRFKPKASGDVDNIQFLLDIVHASLKRLDLFLGLCGTSAMYCLPCTRITQITLDKYWSWTGNLCLNACKHLRVLDLAINVGHDGRQIKDISRLLNTIPQVNLVQNINIDLILMTYPYNLDGGLLNARWDLLSQAIDQVSSGRVFKLFICIRPPSYGAPGVEGLHIYRSILNERLKPRSANASLEVVIHSDTYRSFGYVFYTRLSEIPDNLSLFFAQKVGTLVGHFYRASPATFH